MHQPAVATEPWPVVEILLKLKFTFFLPFQVREVDLVVGSESFPRAVQFWTFSNLHSKNRHSIPESHGRCLLWSDLLGVVQWSTWGWCSGFVRLYSGRISPESHLLLQNEAGVLGYCCAKNGSQWDVEKFSSVKVSQLFDTDWFPDY